MDHAQSSEQMAQDTQETRGAEQTEQTEQTEVRASARPSVSALLPATNEPESAEQRMGAFRNGAYHEKVTVQRVDPQQEQARRRKMLTVGLEIALALGLTLASRIWGWAQEERARARVDRALRDRLPAT